MNTHVSNDMNNGSVTSDAVSSRNNSYDTGMDSKSSSTSTDVLDDPVKINILNNDNQEISIQINNVEEEDHLVHYTDNHFISLTNKDLDRVRNSNSYTNVLPDVPLNEYTSNSPVLSVLDSNRGSRSNSEDEAELAEIVDNTGADGFLHNENRQTTTVFNESAITKHKPHRRRYNKLNYQDIENSISKYYTQTNNAICSREIDILTTYVKGQKHLYAQSTIITQQKLYTLIFPAIIISAAITILSPFVECKPWNTGIISGMNAIVTLFVSMMNFLKFESSVSMFSLLASLFDNIETSLELTTSKLMIMQTSDDVSSVVLAKFNEVETKISDYKLTNATSVPEEIKLLFPVISHVNIFSFIKKTEMHKRNLIEKLRDIKNEIYYILYKWEKQERIIQRQLELTKIPPNPLSKQTKIHEEERLSALYKLKETTKNEIIEFQSAYSVMDNIFSREIVSAEKKHNKWWFLLFCYYWNPPTTTAIYFDDITPILASYFKENGFAEYAISTKHTN